MDLREMIALEIGRLMENHPPEERMFRSRRLEYADAILALPEIEEAFLALAEQESRELESYQSGYNDGREAEF